ncbi:hypothetical protein TRAPUB_11402 [Trametes pubescens]|uniref:C3H1-type domain-containing protein n=1 Tax=Trametes pubescens TaxID=154538 RepID=A0A1M2VX04_TRAPU|nr:hypothetical protein TRAPUB_11402 [Trametes pubescens]
MLGGAWRSRSGPLIAARLARLAGGEWGSSAAPRRPSGRLGAARGTRRGAVSDSESASGRSELESGAHTAAGGRRGECASAPVPSKKVGNFGDWVFAWKRASLATAFAFPHRREELDAYGDFIIGLFGALAPVAHTRVLDFDRAVRKCIGSAKRFTLTDFTEFADLKIQFIDSCGANVHRSEASSSSGNKSGGGRGGGNRKAETCRNYNSDIGCKALAGTCRFRHSCLELRGDRHEEVARPRFLRSFIWDDRAASLKTFTSLSLTHPPVPDVPESVREDPVVNATLANHPELFKIVTPINVDRFEELLEDHPNQDFVKSVVHSLRNGFWPYADAKPADYPDTWDERRPAPRDEESAHFLRTQRDEEVALGRYSESFGKDLLPGMYSMPVHVVPKPHSTKLRLVNDQSAGVFSLNSMIRPESIKGAVLDGIPALGEALRRVRRANAGANLIMWKSDVSQAYRRMPVSPYWQIHQVVTIDDEQHVDRCNLFGGRGSLKVWSAFDCLVAWIAIYKAFVDLKFNYVDDDYGFAELGDVLWYEPYQKYFPSPQTRLLLLWDDLGIPHDLAKQLHAPVLPIIGFEVDPNTMTVSLPSDSKTCLIAAIDEFCAITPGNRRRSLAAFSRSRDTPTGLSTCILC